MAARFLYWMNVSADLRIEHAPGENGGGDWIHIDEKLHREFNARAQELTMMIQGRVTYEIMEDAWPAMRDDPSMPDFLQEYGEIWTSAPKILVSSQRTTASHNTTVINDDAIQKLAQLRSSSEGTIGVGGATIATQLLSAGLLDELLLFTHPVILGEGRPLFDQPHARIDLELLEHRTFDGGVTLHRYAVR